MNIDALVKGFITAALWADAIPLNMDPETGETGGLHHLAPNDELTAKARDLCERFVKAASESDLDAFMIEFGDPDGGEPEEYIGHTFYLDAAGHGVSFTDRAWRDDDPMTAVCQRLHEVAKQFPEVEHNFEVYQIDDETAGL